MNLFSRSVSSGNAVDAVLDIRSGSVGAALVGYNEAEKPKIYWSYRKSVDFLSEHDTDRLLYMTQKALETVAKKIQKEGLHSCRKQRNDDISLGEVRCFFAAPWQVGSPQEITITDSEKFLVDEHQIDLAKEEAEELFSQDAIDRFGTESENLRRLTTEVFSVWCNGYELDDPLGIYTDRLRVATYISMLPNRVKNLTEENISEHLHPDKISLHSFTAAIHTTFTQAFTHPKTFLVINIDEEMTQLLVVNSGVLMGSVSYPLGSHFLTRTLAKALDVPAADARTRLRQYQNKEADKQTQKAVDNVVEQARNRWQELLVSSLDEFSQDVSIPDYAFILSSHAASPHFAEFSRNISVKEHLLTEDSFQIHTVNDDLLNEHIESKGHVDHYLGMASMVKRITQET